MRTGSKGSSRRGALDTESRRGVRVDGVSESTGCPRLHHHEHMEHSFVALLHAKRWNSQALKHAKLSRFSSLLSRRALYQAIQHEHMIGHPSTNPHPQQEVKRPAVSKGDSLEELHNRDRSQG
jgi:hypothetical protein